MKAIKIFIVIFGICLISLNSIGQLSYTNYKSFRHNYYIFNQTENSINKSLSSRHFYIGYSGSIVETMGVRVAYSNNWGMYASARTYYFGDYSAILGITKNIFRTGNLQLLFGVGAGLGNWGWLYDNRTSDMNAIFEYWEQRNAPEIELYPLLRYRFLYITLGATVLIDKGYYIFDLTYGIGFSF